MSKCTHKQEKINEPLIKKARRAPRQPPDFAFDTNHVPAEIWSKIACGHDIYISRNLFLVNAHMNSLYYGLFKAFFHDAVIARMATYTKKRIAIAPVWFFKFYETYYHRGCWIQDLSMVDRAEIAARARGFYVLQKAIVDKMQSDYKTMDAQAFVRTYARRAGVNFARVFCQVLKDPTITGRQNLILTFDALNRQATATFCVESQFYRRDWNWHDPFFTVNQANPEFDTVIRPALMELGAKIKKIRQQLPDSEWGSTTRDLLKKFFAFLWMHCPLMKCELGIYIEVSAFTGFAQYSSEFVGATVENGSFPQSMFYIHYVYPLSMIFHEVVLRIFNEGDLILVQLGGGGEEDEEKEDWVKWFWKQLEAEPRKLPHFTEKDNDYDDEYLLIKRGLKTYSDMEFRFHADRVAQSWPALDYDSYGTVVVMF